MLAIINHPQTAHTNTTSSQIRVYTHWTHAFHDNFVCPFDPPLNLWASHAFAETSLMRSASSTVLAVCTKTVEYASSQRVFRYCYYWRPHFDDVDLGWSRQMAAINIVALSGWSFVMAKCLLFISINIGWHRLYGRFNATFGFNMMSENV